MQEAGRQVTDRNRTDRRTGPAHGSPAGPARKLYRSLRRSAVAGAPGRPPARGRSGADAAGGRRRGSDGRAQRSALRRDAGAPRAVVGACPCAAVRAGVLALAVPAGRPLAAAPAPADAAFELTVDSIMRGPGLVGYPPGALRWSGDSERLYFEWRPRGEDEPATWEVARACLGAAAAPAAKRAPAAKTCEPRRLTDDERRLAPPAGGEWDPAHRRSVGVVDGDVVVVDTVARTRTLITRTAAVEAHARWSDGGRAVTFVRDGGLHRVWVDRRPDQADAAATVAAFEQLTDAGPPKPRPPTTDSQQFLKSEEAQLLAVVRENEARKARADARKDAQAVVARGRRRAAIGRRSGARAPGQGGLRAGRRQAGGGAPRRRPVLRHRIELSGAAARPDPRRRRAGAPAVWWPSTWRRRATPRCR